MLLNRSISDMTAVMDRWGDFLVNPNYARKGLSVDVDWARPERWPEDLTFDRLVELEAARQFSFQALDGSLFLLRYRFSSDGRSVAGASLSFAKCEVVESGEQRLPWIRFDLDPESAAGVTHPPCHLHLGSFAGIRIAVSTLPTPAQFVELVAAWFFPDVLARERLNENKEYIDRSWVKWVNSRSAEFCEVMDMEDIPHVRIPVLAN